MRKIIVVIAAILSLVACQKPFETSIELGVNSNTIDLPSFEEGHCYITVFSNGPWTINLSSGADWATLGRNSGEGIGYVRLDYGENLAATWRTASVVVEGSGKKIEILVNQPSE